jgi:hypothetical protein
MKNEVNLDQASSANGFLLVFRGKDWDEGLSRDQVQEVMDRFMAWSEGLARSGKVVSGQALSRTGVVLGKGGRTVADGPFAETKEAIGGYMLLQVETLEEAVALAKTFPGLEFDCSIEIRPVLDECPSFKRIRERFGIVPNFSFDRSIAESAVVV